MQQTETVFNFVENTNKGNGLEVERRDEDGGGWRKRNSMLMATEDQENSDSKVINHQIHTSKKLFPKITPRTSLTNSKWPMFVRACSRCCFPVVF